MAVLQLRLPQWQDSRTVWEHAHRVDPTPFTAAGLAWYYHHDKDYDEAIGMLLDDRADALVADAPICLVSRLRYAEAGFTTLKKPLTVEPIGIAVAPNDPLLINLVENYLKAAAATGALDALKERWFKNGDWLSRLPKTERL